MKGYENVFLPESTHSLLFGQFANTCGVWPEELELGLAHHYCCKSFASWQTVKNVFFFNIKIKLSPRNQVLENDGRTWVHGRLKDPGRFPPTPLRYLRGGSEVY